MSETPHNESERDARLSAIYRAADAAAPPAALDAAILAAARREVGARQRPAGFAFSSSWRTSLSIAAALVLSVSLVTLMREEAPELISPRVDMSDANAKLKSSTGADDRVAPAERGLAREEQQPKNIGLRPPQSGSPSGLGMRQPEFAEGFPQSKKDAIAGKAEAAAPARSEAAMPAPELASSPSTGGAAVGAITGSMADKAQAKPASPAAASKLERGTNLAPDKWLERIEELRKQGKLDEAKASLAEFRKRYPVYRLPDTLREWAQP